MFFFLPVLAALLLSFTDFDIYALGDLGPAALRRPAATIVQLLQSPLFWNALRQHLLLRAGGRAAVGGASRSARRCW
ncbi:MAG: hypothetical protein MZV65_00075 [Chromatiales bacterium]|nr:hypothetical protein [Chromatiales bacterium]